MRGQNKIPEQTSSLLTSRKSCATFLATMRPRAIRKSEPVWLPTSIRLSPEETALLVRLVQVLGCNRRKVLVLGLWALALRHGLARVTESKKVVAVTRLRRGRPSRSELDPIVDESDVRTSGSALG